MNSIDKVRTPRTQGIKYAGSKLKMLPHILELAGSVGARTVFDGFSGTTRVSQALARTGCSVIANDVSAWSRVLGVCYLLGGGASSRYRQIISHLNGLRGEDGWFTEHYGGDGSRKISKGRDGLKKPFQYHNTLKLDAIRNEIDRMGLSDTERCVALTSLVLALDKVDSTLGHFASYLREWSPRSYSDLRLEIPRIPPSREGSRVIRGDVFETLGAESADLAYFDPPYGSNNESMPPSRVRYGAYYHLWTTVVLNDRPELFGKACRRVDSADNASPSRFEDFRIGDDGEFIAVSAIRELLRKCGMEFVILSYSSGGRATRAALERILRSEGKLLRAMEFDHRRNVMASMHWTGDWLRKDPLPNREYLFLLQK